MNLTEEQEIEHKQYFEKIKDDYRNMLSKMGYKKNRLRKALDLDPQHTKQNSSIEDILDIFIKSGIYDI